MQLAMAATCDDCLKAPQRSFCPADQCHGSAHEPAKKQFFLLCSYLATCWVRQFQRCPFVNLQARQIYPVLSYLARGGPVATLLILVARCISWTSVIKKKKDSSVVLPRGMFHLGGGNKSILYQANLSCPTRNAAQLEFSSYSNSIFLVHFTIISFD